MSGLIDDVIYYLTAPLRLFGRSRGVRLVALATAALVLVPQDSQAQDSE